MKRQFNCMYLKEKNDRFWKCNEKTNRLAPHNEQDQITTTYLNNYKRVSPVTVNKEILPSFNGVYMIQWIFFTYIKRYIGFFIKEIYPFIMSHLSFRTHGKNKRIS